jgi:hypothetical protein
MSKGLKPVSSSSLLGTKSRKEAGTRELDEEDRKKQGVPGWLGDHSQVEIRERYRN